MCLFSFLILVFARPVCSLPFSSAFVSGLFPSVLPFARSSNDNKPAAAAAAAAAILVACSWKLKRRGGGGGGGDDTLRVFSRHHVGNAAVDSTIEFRHNDE